jgi:hypothetical protein
MLNAKPKAAKTMKHSLRGKLGTFLNMDICSSRVIVSNFRSQNAGPEGEENRKLIGNSIHQDKVLTIKASYSVDSDNHEDAFDRAGKYAKI